MQTMILFFRHDIVADILRYAFISCLISLVVIAGLAAFDIAHFYPAP